MRALCNEDEWEQIKQELVQYVMKRDENIAQKIELLLKDGYCLSLSLTSRNKLILIIDCMSNVYRFSLNLQYLVSLRN